MTKATGCVAMIGIMGVLYAYEPHVQLPDTAGTNGLYDVEIGDMVYFDGPKVADKGMTLRECVDSSAIFDLDDKSGTSKIKAIYNGTKESGGVVEYIADAMSDAVMESSDAAMDSCNSLLEQSLAELNEACGTY